jgi:hypothetical protein
MDQGLSSESINDCKSFSGEFRAARKYAIRVPDAAAPGFRVALLQHGGDRLEPLNGIKLKTFND